MTEPLAVPIPEAARLGGVGRSTIYSEISNGNLRMLKIGRRTVITLDDFRSWLTSKVQKAAYHDHTRKSPALWRNMQTGPGNLSLTNFSLPKIPQY